MNFDKKSMILTAGFYTIVLFLVLFFGFTTPLPLPGEEGILIDFGDSDAGYGVIEPSAQQVVERRPQPVPETPQENLTQDYEPAPAIEETPVTKPTPQPTVEDPVEETPEPIEEVEETPVVNRRALYQRTNTSTSTSEGTAGGDGNQGVAEGVDNAPSHSLGQGLGEGIGFDLQGRSHITLPPPVISVQEEGKVVVQIKVDRKGRVTNAEPGVKGSTTMNRALLAAAKKAALAARFNTKDDAPIIQVGTITYIFRLK